MADCLKCGKKIGFFNNGSDGQCSECVHSTMVAAREDGKGLYEEALLKEEARNAEIEAILLTTETSPNLNITKRLKIVVSSKESSLDLKLATKQEELFFDLKEKCHALGGNAVVGVSMNIVETYAATFGVGEFKKFALIAYGTAVVVEVV